MSRRGSVTDAALAALLLAGLTACQPSAPADSTPRYEVHAVQTSGGPVAVRFDTATGRVERSPLAGGRVWVEIGEAPSAPGESGSRPGRFALDFARSPSIPLTFLRIDRDTGAVWRLAYPRDQRWVSYLESTAPTTTERPPRPPRAASPTPAAARPGSARSPGPEQSVSDESSEAFVGAIRSGFLPTEMRVWAIEQLSAASAEQAVEPLIEALADEDGDVVRIALRMLGKYDDPRIGPAAQKLVEDDRPLVRRAARVLTAKIAKGR
jgi:hypothetical protein